MTIQVGVFPQSPADERVIDLRLGQPSPSLLPLEAIREAASRRLVGDPLVLQYGAAQGYRAFREALAAFIAREEGREVDPDQLMLTAGTSLALSLVADQLARPGQAIASEDPTYFLAKGIFDTHALEVVGIPVDEAGIDVDVLEQRLAAGLRPAFVYVIPAFQNPTGVVLTPARAERLIELAEQHDFVVVADEPYPMLHYADVRPQSLVARDRGRGRVLSLGSFSKILAPGLRLGWIEGESPLLARLLDHGVHRSGGALNPVMASVVHGTLESGFLHEHVARLRQTLGERAAALADAVTRRLPGTRASEPLGGYFLWLALPERRDQEELLRRARNAGVGFAPGPRCAIDRDLSQFLRLSFAFYEPTELEEAVARLAGVLATG